MEKKKSKSCSIYILDLIYTSLINMKRQTDMSAWLIYQADICFSFYQYIGIGQNGRWPQRCWQNAVIFLTHPDNLHKKAQRTKSKQLSCSNASRCLFINKQTRWTMKHASAVAAKTKESSLITLI